MPLDTYDAIRCNAHLPPGAAQELLTKGFVVLPGPIVAGGLEHLRASYDVAVAIADPADVRIATSTRVTDFVNRSAEFDGIYVYPPLLAACCLVIGRPFKLSNTCARTLEPGAPAQKLHVDVERGADGSPMLGYIWMIDPFDGENGATRFVPGSHLSQHGPNEAKSQGNSQEEVLACGDAGSLIVFDASIWHGHAANRSSRRRRSVQGHFVPRDAAAAIDYRARIRPDTVARIGDLARYVLDLPPASSDSAQLK